jgi:hypothetical protein
MSAAAGPVLRDIHVPLDAPWWPLAPAWWLLIAVLLVALAFASHRVWRAWRVARLRRVLLRAHDELAAAHAAPDDGAALVAGLSLLLRRASKRHAPQALRLRDEDWLAFLDGGDPARPFREGPGRLLLDGPYRARIDAHDAQALSALVRERLARFAASSRHA